MGLRQNIQLDTQETGTLSEVYMRIPRNDTLRQHSEKHITGDFEIWSSYDARLEANKKPLRTISVRILDCTQEDIDGVAGTPAVIKNNEVVQEAIPAKSGLRDATGKDEYVCSFNTVIDEEALDDYVYAHMRDLVEGKKIGAVEARKLGIVTQFYNYIKANETDFAGIDMTTAIDHP
jgi:hypothetical protein